MQKYLEMPIKKVIDDYPRIGDFLEDCNIGCVPCSVGTCLLGDIVTIHNLSKKNEAQLMYKIEKEVHPDRDVKLKEVVRDEEVRENVLKYSPPMKQLVDEHMYIKQMLAYIPQLIELIREPGVLDKELVLNSVRFIREYADKFHHAKEEDILFDYTDKSLEIINVILEDHKTARNHMKAVVEAVDREDKDEISRHFSSYKELLTEHIKKEDEVLYPWIDRSLSTKQVGELFHKFSEANRKLGDELPCRNLDFLKSLDEKFLQ